MKKEKLQGLFHHLDDEPRSITQYQGGTKSPNVLASYKFENDLVFEIILNRKHVSCVYAETGHYTHRKCPVEIRF